MNQRRCHDGTTTIATSTWIVKKHHIKHQRGKIRYQLEDILFIAVAGMLANAGSWSEIADFVQVCLHWLRKYIERPKGFPLEIHWKERSSG